MQLCLQSVRATLQHCIQFFPIFSPPVRHVLNYTIFSNPVFQWTSAGPVLLQDRCSCRTGAPALNPIHNLFLIKLRRHFPVHFNIGCFLLSWSFSVQQKYCIWLDTAVTGLELCAPDAQLVTSLHYNASILFCPAGDFSTL